MSTRLVLATLVGFLWVSIAVAHRLDEYLQATVLTVEPEQLTLQLRLIPGVAVSSKVLAAIDTNRDGVISDGEKQNYAARVGQDLSLSLNGTLVMLRPVASFFPSVREISQGMGGMLLSFAGSIPKGHSTYQLRFENHHQPAGSVYLVNCLVPKNPAIHILAQSRNYDQSVYQLKFSLHGASRLRPPTALSTNPPVEPTWPNRESVLKTYLVHGVGHILTGFDHLLFLSALVLATVSFWELVKIVTVFTLAHSLTLTLASFRLVHLPPPIVEPLIAASIIFVALQNVFWPSYAHGRSRLLAVFVFGLFHGLGFASGLLPVMHALPRSFLLWAIVGFSGGVEMGHQLILLPLFGILKAIHYSQWNAPRPEQLFTGIQRLGSGVIALAGLYYLVVTFTNNS